MRMHRWGSLAVVAAVSLAGCGGGGERLTKAEYVRQGNELCERIEQRVTEAASAAFTEQGQIPSTEEITDFANETLAPAIDEELEGLRELSPPEEDEERVDDILTAGQRAVDEVRRDPTGLIGERNPLENYDELADGYGLERCGAISEDVERALSGLGAGGPVRGGDTGGAEGGQQPGQTDEVDGTEGTGDTGEPGQDMGGPGGEPADPTETTESTDPPVPAETTETTG